MKMLTKFLMAMVLATISINVSAVPIATAGIYDSLIAQETLANSGSGTEESWIEGILGEDISYTQLTGSGGGSWEGVVGGVAGDYAFDFGMGIDPSHFLVKVGGGGGTGTDETHFLYENKESFQWAFINLANFGAGVSLTNIGVISHVGITDPVSAPAPGPLVVMAIGLLGIMGISRVKKFG